MDDPRPSNRADPHRRLLRHTYQEGPGFLFLATRGGRPPGTGRPARTSAALRFRARCVRVAREEGIAAALDAGRQPGKPPSLARAAMPRAASRRSVDRPRGPGPTRLPAWVEQAVIVVRLLTYWNRKRLAAEFTRREICPLDHHAVDRPAGRPRHRPARRSAGSTGRRTSASRPNELWHIDIKGPFFLRRPGASTRRSGSSASSTITPASSSACASCPGRRRRRSSPGSTTASSCAACRSS